MSEDEGFLECGICGKVMPKKTDLKFDITDDNKFCTIINGWMEIYAPHHQLERLLYTCPKCSVIIKTALDLDKDYRSSNNE